MSLSPAVLRHWAGQHNRKGTRSAHRLVANLQQPLVDRLRLIRTYASGPFTEATLDEAIAALTASEE